MMSVTSIVRYLQGERPGMSAGVLPDPAEQSLADILYPDLLFAPTIAIQTSVRLADVSFWQEEIDFVQMKQAAIAGTIIRAGQRNWVDKRFKENWQKAKTAGVPRGSYWLYDSREDPIKQAELWWAQIQGDPGELVHVADFEESYGGAYGKKEHFKLFLQHFQKISKLPDHRIAVYTGFFWWLKRVGNDLFFRRFALWLAWYAAMGVVKVPLPWTESDLIFWQYTDSGDGSFYGVSSQEIDLNYYCCNLATFNKRFLLGSTEPDEGDPMGKYFRLNTTGANIRTGPGTSYPDKGDLARDDVVEELERVGNWSRFRIAQHPNGTPVTLADGTPLDGTHGDYWSTNAYFVEVTSLPNPPVPDPPPTPQPDTTVTITAIQIVNPERVTITWSDGSQQTYP
jgi:lysozyme